MKPLRLGTKCAVIDGDGRVLLSKRGDLNIWNLPGGRLDSGEAVSDAAAREVLEETGIKATITHPIGLYYWQHWGRMNMLFAAKAVGGRLLQRTDETKANRYFAPGDFPHDLTGQDDLDALIGGQRPLPKIIALPRMEFWQTTLRLKWRWLKNWLSGRPEPQFVSFKVQAVAAIFSSDHQHILTLPGTRLHTLPRVTCDGRAAPWVQLAQSLHIHCTPPTGALHWAGLWQDPTSDTLEFIFTAAIPHRAIHSEGAVWSQAQNAPLAGKDAEYLSRIPADYASMPIWMIIPPRPRHAIIGL